MVLAQNYPNPFNAATTIHYYLNQPSYVTIDIYNLLGRKVETLVPGLGQTGNHRAVWDSKNNPTGIYFYKINSGDYSVSMKMLLLK